ncbi:glycosyltransferase, partial [Jannaschia rubra]
TMTGRDPTPPTAPARIAFFLPHLRHGGVERVCTTLIRGLRRALFDPMVILQRREGEFLDLLDGVDVLALRNRRAPLCVAELALLLKRHRVRLVYSATTATNIYACAAASLTGTRAIVSEHTPLAGNLAEAKWRGLRLAAIRAAYPRASLAAAPLPRIGEELHELLGDRCPPFLCLPNPVVDAVLPPRPTAPRATRLISVGRLAEVKRFDLMIEAFAVLHRAAPDTTLEILGEGPERPRLAALIGSLGLGGAVSLPGFAADVPGRMRGADLFLCTSRREGFGNAIVEAMAAGVPVVSVDCPVGPEVLLRGGTAGRLVRTHTPEAFGAALVEVSGDPDLRRAHALAGHEVAGDFTVGTAVAAHDRAFAKVLGLSA